MFHGRNCDGNSDLGNRTMGEGDTLAQALGIHNKQGSKRIQLQVGVHQAILVEGNTLCVIILLLVWLVFKQQQGLIPICGSVAFGRIREGSTEKRRTPCTSQHSRR